MPRNQSPDLTITSEKEFEDTLATLVEECITSGVDVRGTWEFETSEPAHEWEAEFLELARESDDADE